MTATVLRASSESAKPLMISFRGDLTASLIAELVAGWALGPLTYRDALEVIGGHAALCFPDATVTDLLAKEFERRSARVSHRDADATGVRVINVRWARGGRESLEMLRRALAACEEPQAIAEELMAELTTSRRQTALLLQLVEASGLAEDAAAVLTALEALDADGVDGVRDWLGSDGSRWVRRSSGAAELWLDV